MSRFFISAAAAAARDATAETFKRASVANLSVGVVDMNRCHRQSRPVAVHDATRIRARTLAKIERVFGMPTLGRRGREGARTLALIEFASSLSSSA